MDHHFHQIEYLIFVVEFTRKYGKYMRLYHLFWENREPIDEKFVYHFDLQAKLELRLHHFEFSPNIALF